jgi:hypothetical protein
MAGDSIRWQLPWLPETRPEPGLHHRIIAILLLLKLNMERTLNQLSLMLQQPLTADDNPPVVATVKAIDRNVERILLAPSGWDDTTQPEAAGRFATSVVRSC